MPNDVKFISIFLSQQFPSDRKVTILCKTLGRVDKQLINFRTDALSKKSLQIATISGKIFTSSKKVSARILASDHRDGGYVGERSHSGKVCERVALAISFK